MRRFVEGVDRGQSTLFPECLEDWIGEDNPVRVIDVFVDELDLVELGFSGVDPEATGRPSYHPSVRLCHVGGSCRRWPLAVSVHDDQDQLQRVSLPSGDHPAGHLALCPFQALSR